MYIVKQSLTKLIALTQSGHNYYGMTPLAISYSIQCTTAVDDSHCRHQWRAIPLRGPHKGKNSRTTPEVWKLPAR
jgi:hypothetical protein